MPFGEKVDIHYLLRGASPS